MLLGLDNWSFGFAWGMRREFLPSRPLTVEDLLRKTREYGLKGVQVGLNDMPSMGTTQLRALRDKVEELGLFLEVSAGLVSEEAEVQRALDYAVAFRCQVVRAFMECFGIQFELESLDDYVDEGVMHLRNLMPEVERRNLFLCLENHGGLRTEHLRKVFSAVRSDHLAACLDTGNAVLTLEDPLEVALELASRTRTVHLKDWNLVKTDYGVLARGCSLGDGVVDLPRVLEILERNAPDPDGLHLNIETAQEYIPLGTSSSAFWRHHPGITGRELGNFYGLVERRSADPAADHRLAVMRGAPEAEILEEEELAVRKSVRYAREDVRL